MVITSFKIIQIKSTTKYGFCNWRIDLTLVPTWFDRVFSGKYFPEDHTLTGSGTCWYWSTGRRASYLWSWWARAAIKMNHNETTEGMFYVNRRFGRSKNERSSQSDQD